MSTITIPAREILAGDVLDLGGQPVEVTKSEPHPSPDVPVHYLWLRVPGFNLSNTAMHGINPDDVYVVTRPEPPDPDAAVVEAMAEWLCGHEDGFDLATLSEQVYADDYRRSARHLLAIAREAGAL